MTSGSGGVLRIGTRRSTLARAQADGVARTLTSNGYACSVVPMSTRGDSGASLPLGAGGVKGLFVDEIVKALRAGDIDVAVHSAKDLPAFDPDGVVVAAVPPRAPACDVLVTRTGTLQTGALVGTSSLRRRAQFTRSRPQFSIGEIRGNIDTRLARLQAGEFDGLLLAQAGLIRLGLSPSHVEVLDTSEMLPAPAQGSLAIQTRSDGPARDAVRELDDPRSRAAWETERYLVQLIGADCALPVGAYAWTVGSELRLDTAVFAEDGSREIRTHAVGNDPRDVASRAASFLLKQGAGSLLAPYAAQAEAS